MNLTFHGAARQVTGSMCLLELNDGYKILIDCGIDFEAGRNGSQFPFEPSEIDLVLLTHAHLDHSGNLPNLYLNGYKGQVLSTSPTHALTQLILNDAATLHSKNLKRKLNRKKYSGRKISDEEVLENHIEEAADRFVTLAFENRFEVKENLFVTFIQAGHLLGAANILIEVHENGGWKRLLFSGDIGRKNYPLLNDPAITPQVDYLICETTYGNRKHKEKESPEELLYQIIKKACVDIPGRLIIPSFSVGRTQALLYTLNKLASEQRLPAVKVFADSPMAEACTRIYEKNIHLLNEEARKMYEKEGSIFDFSNLVAIKSAKESKAVSQYHEPCIILSSSGMITGGRIQDHIKRNLKNQYCTILLVGYCAEGTTGYALYQGEKYLSVKGKNIAVQANILNTDVFSGHADEDGLLDFVKQQDPGQLKNIFLVHGEFSGMKDFKEKLLEEGYKGIEIPEKDQSFRL